MSGCRFGELQDSYKVEGLYTVAQIIRQVCKVLWKTLRDIVMPHPTEEDWLGISKGFAEMTHFPNCVGALAGKHVRLMGPEHHSVVFVGLCDARYRFVCAEIDACWDESSWNFARGALYRSLAEKRLDIPGPRPVTGYRIIASPHVVVADRPFGGPENVVVPYAKGTLTYDQEEFNNRIALPRYCAETTFRIVTKKWRILHRPLNVNVEFAAYIVGAICTLHNYVCDKDGYDYGDSLHASPLQDVTGPAADTAGSAPRYDPRTELADYFGGEGSSDSSESS